MADTRDANGATPSHRHDAWRANRCCRSRLELGDLRPWIPRWRGLADRSLLTLRGPFFESPIAISPDGKRIVWGGIVWDAQTGRQVLTLSPEVPGKYEESVVTFSPNGRRIASGANLEGRAVARVFDAITGQTLHTLRGNDDDFYSLCFSPDGTQLVSASTDATARVWSADDAREITLLKGHLAWVTHAAFSPDGSHVATASPFDLTARVWRADGSGTPLILRGHEARILRRQSPPGITVAFSADGSRVLTVGFGTARVWRVTWPVLVDYLRARLSLCLTAEQRIRYLAESPPEARATYEACERRFGR